MALEPGAQRTFGLSSRTPQIPFNVLSRTIVVIILKFFFISKLFIVLDKTLKGTRGVRLDNQKVIRAPGPRTKYFERFYFCRSINYK